jgi:hypothetical protein
MKPLVVVSSLCSSQVFELKFGRQKPERVPIFDFATLLIASNFESSRTFHLEMIAQQKEALHKAIADLTLEKRELVASLEAVQNSAHKLDEGCQKWIAECQSVATQIVESHDLVSTEASIKAAHIIEDAVEQAATTTTRTAQEESGAWEAEKARLSHIQEFKSLVMLDVGGCRFTTSLTTLQRFPDTMIGAMFSGRHALPTAGEYFFIDRDGTHFRHILNFLRQPEGFKVDLPEGPLDELKRECKYYGLLDEMFPWTPAEPITVTNTLNQPVLVTQRKRAVVRQQRAPEGVSRVLHGRGRRPVLPGVLHRPLVRRCLQESPASADLLRELRCEGEGECEEVGTVLAIFSYLRAIPRCSSRSSCGSIFPAFPSDAAWCSSVLHACPGPGNSILRL